MGIKFFNTNPTGGLTWKHAWLEACRGGTTNLTSTLVSGFKLYLIFYFKNLKNIKMDSSKINENTMEVVDEVTTEIVNDAMDVGAAVAGTSAEMVPAVVEDINATAEEGVMATAEAEASSAAETIDSEAAFNIVGSKMNRLHFNNPKLSGAQRRKLLVQRALENGEPVPPKPRRKTRTGNKTSGTCAAVLGNTATPKKRNRSEVSTPSTGEQVLKRPKQNIDGAKGSNPSDPGTSTYSQALTGHKMIIVPKDFPKSKLSKESSDVIQKYIFSEVLKTSEALRNNKGTQLPSFQKNSLERGGLVMVCCDDFTRSWLMERVSAIPDSLKICVKVGPFKDLIREFKAIFFVSNETKSLIGSEDPKEVIRILGLQNPIINVESVKILNIQKESKGHTYIVTLDEESVQGIRDLGYRVSLGLEKISVRIPADRKNNANAEGDTD